MYKKQRVAVVIPAYNEEKLISKTISTLPDFMDYIVVINDGSTDETLSIVKRIAKKDKRLIVIDNEKNLGLGASMARGYKKVLETKTDLVSIMPGDGQCDPSYLPKMIDELHASGADYIKSNRFVDLAALKSMPRFRRFGNVFITLLTKFATGYYSIFDTQNSFGVMRRSALESVPMHLIGGRYEFENTQLIAMSIAGVRIKDFSTPATYGEETSTIDVLPTALRVLRSLWVGFWRRIYYKYILFNFHPVALLFISGSALTLFGLLFGLYVSFLRIFDNLSPSTGTVMLVVLPFVLGFQLLLSALIMDVANEGK